jgi:hypothetical protein
MGERVRTTKIRMSKVKKNIENLKRIRTSKVSIKRIRASKDQNADNYLWHNTYGYQGMARSHGLVVKADDSWSRGLSSNPDTVYWMDVSDYIQTMKITKIKVAKWGTPKKYFKKKRPVGG